MLSSDRIRGPTRLGKALNLIFLKLSSQNIRGFAHATIFSPSFHGLRLAQPKGSKVTETPRGERKPKRRHDEQATASEM